MAGEPISNLRVDQMAHPHAFVRGTNEMVYCVIDQYNKIVKAEEQEDWYLTQDVAGRSFIFNKPETGVYIICSTDKHIKLDIGMDNLRTSKMIRPY